MQSSLLILIAGFNFPIGAAALHLHPDCATTLINGGVHCQRGFASPALVAALRRDLRDLAPSFQQSASFSSNGVEDDLRAALTCRPNMESDTFDKLYEQLCEVRTEVEAIFGRELSPGVEATYVIYPAGGYYKRHIDSLAGVDEGGSGRRAVSFICYLVDNEPSWSKCDGGELRIFQTQNQAPGADEAGGHKDILPESGLLVLFDSKRVWHEVCRTRRERACLVGWFREV